MSRSKHASLEVLSLPSRISFCLYLVHLAFRTGARALALATSHAEGVSPSLNQTRYSSDSQRQFNAVASGLIDDQQSTRVLAT